MIRQISPKIQFTPKFAQINEISERSHDQAPVQMHTGSNPAHAGRPRPRSTNTNKYRSLHNDRRRDHMCDRNCDANMLDRSATHFELKVT